MMSMIAGTMTMDKVLKALFIGKTREAWSDEPYTPIYYVIVEDERGKERRFEVDVAVFDKILQAAGEPEYTEPNYWTYDGAAIAWNDVLPARIP